MKYKFYPYGARVYHREDFILILEKILTSGGAHTAQLQFMSKKLRNPLHLLRCIATLKEDGFIEPKEMGPVTIYTITEAGRVQLDKYDRGSEKV